MTSAGATAGRLFVAVPLEEQVRSEIESHLRHALDRRPLPGRPVRPANWHITLRFLGDTSREQLARVQDALSSADLGSGFELEFTALGAFPRPDRARVVWLGTGEGAHRLREMAAVVELASVHAGFDAERRPFKSHLTLSRLKPEGDVRELLASVEPMAVRQPVHRLVLYRSHLRPTGAEYEEVSRYPLAAA